MELNVLVEASESKWLEIYTFKLIASLDLKDRRRERERGRGRDANHKYTSSLTLQRNGR